MVQSPVLEPVSSKYKLKLKYGGYFRLAKNSSRKRYCFGFQKSIYIDAFTYNLEDLLEEVTKHYPSNMDLIFSTCFVDKCAMEQTFIELDSNENFELMLSMYNTEKESTLYVTTNNNIDISSKQQRVQDEVTNEPHGEEESEYSLSDESYHSHYSTDNEVRSPDDEEETSSLRKKCPTMKVNSKFKNVIEFRRAINHYALVNEFEYLIEKSDLIRFTARCAHIECNWRIHASITQDGVTFEVKTFVETHSCTRSNKGGNKLATQGWVASVVTDKLKSDGDVSVTDLRKWVMKNYSVDVSYLKVYRGKEQAYTDMYGKWEDSFMKMNDFKEELVNRNPGSVVDIDYETDGNKKLFLRFFISLIACSKGFLDGCRPYIALDACHLKGKFNGVLVAATSVDGNNSIFPVAYGVLESENKSSWIWFLELLKKAIGTPNGLVISSDMQKGFEVAITQVYPSVEHRECIRHLYSNFKKHFRGEFFSKNLWRAARTYSVTEHERLLTEIAGVRKDALTYIIENHKKIWSRCKFGTTSKCDYITNNISEAFNSWVGELRYQPVLDLLDSIREKIMVRFDKKRRILQKWKGTLVPNTKSYLNKISKNLGEYDVCRSGENRAEVKCRGKRWEVLLDERKCTCRVWQVKGIPCVHAAAFIAFTRDVNWDKYVDSYFITEKLKATYALEVAPMPAKDQWVHIDTGEKIYPPTIKRPPGRPRKNRILSHDEPKRRHRCSRCSEYGHHAKTCKNASYQSFNQHESSTSKRGRGRSTKASRKLLI
ncbi:hypothetical protein L1987_37716 [Smallanthus sonchifolius]|uniref:Uncharacterized protein n=1 Tax=Smallanthus sonchifolius TaxID=185202 RepID=A0ACB9HJP2_9ASTR|nr:hypothetical protein L1987_37716 [Smallanthus sonchifolius]